MALDNNFAGSITWNLNLLPNTSWVDFGYNNSDSSSFTVNSYDTGENIWALEINGLDIGD
jgi:hypothetical protein